MMCDLGVEFKDLVWDDVIGPHTIQKTFNVRVLLAI